VIDAYSVEEESDEEEYEEGDEKWEGGG